MSLKIASQLQAWLEIATKIARLKLINFSKIPNNFERQNVQNYKKIVQNNTFDMQQSGECSFAGLIRTFSWVPVLSVVQNFFSNWMVLQFLLITPSITIFVHFSDYKLLAPFWRIKTFVTFCATAGEQTNSLLEIFSSNTIPLQLNKSVLLSSWLKYKNVRSFNDKSGFCVDFAGGNFACDGRWIGSFLRNSSGRKSG